MTGKIRTCFRAPSPALVAAATAALLAGACTSSGLNLSTGASSTSTSGASTTTATPTNAATTIPPPTTAAASAPPATVIVSHSAPCHARSEFGYVLPDPACTPGSTNPDVTAGNIGETICAYGWTRTVRPPESYTESLKRAQMAEYGETRSISAYEEDHLIPLELGGAPGDPHNLWPDPGSSPNPKDDVENAANRAVCDGRMSLAAAQHQIATDWVAFGRSLGVITAPGNQRF